MLFTLYLSIWIDTLCVCTMRQCKHKMNLQSRLSFDNILILSLETECLLPVWISLHTSHHTYSIELLWCILNLKSELFWQDITNMIKLNVTLNFTCMHFSQSFCYQICFLSECSASSRDWKCSFLVKFWCIFTYYSNCQSCKVVIKLLKKPLLIHLKLISI